MSFDGRIEALIKIPTGGVTFSATNGAGGPSTVTVPAGDYYATDEAGGGEPFITDLELFLNTDRPSGWTVSLSYSGATATGKVTINCTSTPWSITWTSTALRDLLGFTGNVVNSSVAVTGSNQMRGLWFPRCPLSLDGDPRMAPKYTDLRTIESPTGNVIGIVGNARRVHKRLRWTHVPKDRFAVAHETITNASWERFLDDTQHGLGNTLFTPSSKCKIVDHAGNQVGDSTVWSWYLKGVENVEPKLTIPGYTGLYTIEIPEISSSG